MSWTKESITSGSALIKLAEGHAEREEAPPATGVVVPAALEIVGYPGRAGVRSSDDRLSDRRTAGRPVLSSLIGEGAEAPVLSGCSSVLCFLRTGKLTAGLFPRGTRDDACRKEFCLSLKEKLREERRVKRPPLVQEWHPRSRTLSAGPSLDLRETNRKSVSKRLSTLSDILKDKKVGRSAKEVVRKKLQSREPV
ncbi:hypothetical protein Cgig2_008909 [Carnegiea gigantea]|uniref:Uncharacterized protein n=1 Tax=Carnegiea gigantea TaxID=171969 RepID=A0A9Q1GVH8_9CARY|nr:hypothetical protein Cgig2_008909 [Carnegiea gigantea]